MCLVCLVLLFDTVILISFEVNRLIQSDAIPCVRAYFNISDVARTYFAQNYLDLKFIGNKCKQHRKIKDS